MKIGRRGGILGRKPIEGGWYCQNSNCPNRWKQPFSSAVKSFTNEIGLRVCLNCQKARFEGVNKGYGRIY